MVHGVARVGHDLAQIPQNTINKFGEMTVWGKNIHIRLGISVFSKVNIFSVFCIFVKRRAKNVRR